MLKNSITSSFQPHPLTPHTEAVRQSHTPLILAVCAGVLIITGLSLAFPIIGRFFDPLSLFVVIGGTMAASSIHCSIADVKLGIDAIMTFLEGNWQYDDDTSTDPQIAATFCLRLARLIKDHGILMLEKESRRAPDDFLRFALEMALDGRSDEEFRKLLIQEANRRGITRDRTEKVLATMAIYAPAMGLVGTLLGLVNLLGNLSDPATVGPSLSLAVVSTLHGAVLAYGLFSPLAGRIAQQKARELLHREVVLEGVSALRREESPRELAERLRTLIPDSLTGTFS